ncbi:MAG TPA: PQQ-binding-like beta-propeller repeat protein [Humisphaera sp.]|nr:PQQ-binding-like beta-propeller repeat protein [Humisphaera sp.]
MNPQFSFPIDSATIPNVARRDFLKAAVSATLAALAFRAQIADAADSAVFTINWPQAAGPNGTWSVEANDVPIHWSVARNQGLIWQTTLPEEGQGGIAIWNDRVFLTTLKPEEGKKPTGRDVVGYCLDARDGKILWTVPLPGSETSIPAYFFSDATSPSPLTDGKHVWFFNACGSLGCFDYTGKQIWLRTWKPTVGRPFNKQFEPMIFGNTLLNMEPRDEGDPKREKDPWNYIRGIDAKTGKTLWVSDDALTHYNTPVFGITAAGEPAVLQGRGGYHGVPETPPGLSLTSLAPGREGKTIWRFEAEPKGKALYTLHWTPKYAFWINIDASEHQVLDSVTGKVLRTQSLTKKVDWRRYDPVAGKHVLETDVDLSKQSPPMRVFPAQLCNIIVGDHHYFLSYFDAKAKVGPPHCVGRIHLETGKVEYLEVPVAMTRDSGLPDQPIWGKTLASSTVNSRGIDVNGDKRSQGDGWWWGYLGSPTAVGGKIFFTTMLGTTYVIDGHAKTLDESAMLAVNDLGVPGKTWSLNSISYAGGRIYHRSIQKIVCAGTK